VVQIAQGDLTLRLEEKGEDEVADVSKAVNELTSNLALHIDSMKQLMANMSHEMKSTVTSLSMSLEITEEELSPLLASLKDDTYRERIAKNLRQARAELEHLENMVSSGLLGGKLDLCHDTLDCAPLDFSSLCRETVCRYTQRAEQNGLSLISSLDDGLWLLGDEVLLDRLVANIVDNACKYTFPGGEIYVSLKVEREFLLFCCLNSHSPLTTEQLNNLCLPYYRAEQGHIQGSGLGLYLANRITVLHGGNFAVENDPQGLLFTISLPLPDELAKQTAF
jgi:signal transduction histidine kinase